MRRRMLALAAVAVVAFTGACQADSPFATGARWAVSSPNSTSAQVAAGQKQIVDAIMAIIVIQVAQEVITFTTT